MDIFLLRLRITKSAFDPDFQVVVNIILVLEVLILMPDKTGKYLEYVLSVQYH